MIEVRPTVTDDLPELSALFQEGFGHPVDAVEWHWKYSLVPGEGRSMVACDERGRLMAHVGAIAVPADWANGRALLWQAVDWVGRVGRGLRPALTAAGGDLLGQVPGPGDLPWIYGFPSERHHRLGHHSLGYRRAGEVRPLEGRLPPGCPDDGVILEVSDQCGQWAEESWSACGVDGIRRSASFLNWRYHARPGRYYRFYRLRSPQSVDGLVVAGFVGREARLTEVWLPAPLDAEACLLAVAADLSAAGLERWSCWPLPGVVEGPLKALGLRPGPEALILSCRNHPGSGDCCGAAASLYYAMGDYDSA